ncbi:MAG TPA: transcriptional regulator [Cytophagales bacterium]|nr:transcriptional regulator [Cytophagales bacterium]HAA22478.1 transcriptional regulator [Cytophagales bacterium]HAP61581.1 transcriptional regulator [Cytophagales bacterium]
MKSIIDKLNKAFENRVRLGIMSALMANDEVDFNQLKDLLGVTDGNLASHLKALEEKKFIETRKQFIGRKPNTRYRATLDGRQAFQSHLEALEALLKGQ